jgi:CHAT domain-containing protein
MKLLVSLGIVLLGPFFLAASVYAQVAAPPQSCAPVRVQGASGLVPAYPGAATQPQVARLLRLGYKQFYQLHLDAVATTTLLSAKSSAQAASDACAEALATYGLADIAENSNFAASEDLYRSALAQFAALHSAFATGTIHMGLGRVYSAKSKSALAIEQYTLAAEDFSAAGNVESELVAKMAVARHSGHDFEPLVAAARQHTLPCTEAQVQYFWGESLYSDNNYQAAMQHYQTADALYANCPGSKGSRVGLQTSMGRLERQQGRPAVALEHYRLALRLQKESGDISMVPQTYNAMAVAYHHLNDDRLAIRYYRKALAVAHQIHSQPFIDFLEANLGSAYSEAGLYRKALPLLERTSQHLTSDHLRCVRFNLLGVSYGRVGQPERALKTLALARAACEMEKDTRNTEDVLESVAAVELLLHNDAAALENSQQGLALLEKRRASVIQADAYKSGFLDENLKLYNDAIAALTALRRPAEAFEIAEQARSRALLDLLGSHAQPASTSAPVPSQLGGSKQSHGELLASTENVAPLTTSAMLEVAGRLNSTLLVYWVAEDTLYIWLAQPGKPVVGATQALKSAKLARLIAATRPKAHVGTGPSAAWRQLYRLLIEPVQDALPTGTGSLLTVIPSGPLFSLSFAGLQAPEGSYLVERFRIHTAPTVGLLAFTRHNAEVAAALPTQFLFVDSPQSLPTVGATRLPLLRGTAAEVDAIARLLPANQVVRLHGNGATVTALRSRVQTATVLHIATHAILNDAEPASSFLVLDDAAHDGRLSVDDIYSLQLHSRLVVLSACSTGLGRITGDGVANMDRAFFYAGAASVLSTLWDIADQPTARLLPHFYESLNGGQTPSAALRSAQLAMLDDLRKRRVRVATLSGNVALPPDPTYWAAFSLTGEP